MSKTPMVSVIMITYNHEKYIEQAIEGVLMQKNNFEVELIISNDASSDNTDEIAKKIISNYKGKIEIRYYNHIQNKGISKNFSWSVSKSRGRYIAICEGDDYWIDSYKLHKQVDFLKKNKDYGIVSTLRKNLNQTTGIIKKEKKLKHDIETCDFKDVILGKKGVIATLTVLVRSSLIYEFIDLYEKNKDEISILDYNIWIYVSYYSKIAILNEYTAVYRILPNSASHSTCQWNLRKHYFYGFIFIIEYFNISSKDYVKEALYLRAKLRYLIASKAKDIKSCRIMDEILLENKDYLRSILLNISNKVPIVIPIIQLIDRYLICLKFKK
ncbi:hypothetical protein Lupro_06225 [Lutibacter profundi]|uniref:Glycosyltransferase 2-like domain-containing protein n=1 Tax=Lutibacter profundi TaxID=1622118 RepID=A0A0X8G6E0_9FLAO|nr:glycosyltransferase [Lutibacter profundi]AMC10863.1 hypothetical protein Lupro_06225 [Lutibacter profundi]